MPAAKRPVAEAGEGAGGPAGTLDPGLSRNWEMIYLFARIFYWERNRSEEALKPMGLTPMQFTILATLARWGGISSAELSRRFNVTPQTMGEMIVNLERRGLVVREQDPRNRRALKLTLTEAGLAMVEDCNQAMAEVEAEMFRGMSAREVEDLRRRLVTLYDNLGIGAERGV